MSHSGDYFHAITVNKLNYPTVEHQRDNSVILYGIL